MGASKSRHPVRPRLDAVPHRAQSSGFGGNKGPLFPSETMTGGWLGVGEGGRSWDKGLQSPVAGM